MQRRLIQDIEYFRAIRAFEQFLARGTQFDSFIDLVGPRSFDDGPSVVVSLQQARDCKRLKTPDNRGRAFVAKILAERGRENLLKLTEPGPFLAGPSHLDE